MTIYVHITIPEQGKTFKTGKIKLISEKAKSKLRMKGTMGLQIYPW